MESLVTLFGYSTEHWSAVLGAVVAILVAVRTALRLVITALRALDLALDGRYDWTILGEASDALDWFDANVLDRLPVKMPLLKSGGK